MNTAHTSPNNYVANVFMAALDLGRAIVPSRPAGVARERADILSFARECRNSSPSLAQELHVIAGRD